MPPPEENPSSERDRFPTQTAGTTRRVFLSQLGAAGIVAATAPLSPSKAASTAPSRNPDSSLSGIVSATPLALIPVTLKINGQQHALKIDPRQTLLDCLREELHFTGTKKGCDHGQCGACTIHVNGQRVNSCLCLAALHEGDDITTIEGLGQPEKLHPMQAAFVACDGFQCGYCTSGQIMSAVALLKEPCGSADTEVKEMMSGNICRCGAYANIVEAIQSQRKFQPA